MLASAGIVNIIMAAISVLLMSNLLVFHKFKQQSIEKFSKNISQIITFKQVLKQDIISTSGLSQVRFLSKSLACEKKLFNEFFCNNSKISSSILILDLSSDYKSIDSMKKIDDKWYKIKVSSLGLGWDKPLKKFKIPTRHGFFNFTAHTKMSKEDFAYIQKVMLPKKHWSQVCMQSKVAYYLAKDSNKSCNLYRKLAYTDEILGQAQLIVSNVKSFNSEFATYNADFISSEKFNINKLKVTLAPYFADDYPRRWKSEFLINIVANVVE